VFPPLLGLATIARTLIEIQLPNLKI